uniref:Type II toxin-antitoxin system ParD family antitoxin n=1 Tax=Globodera pallida TaxID=36090 RepID=A0A183BS19_GLOPA
MLKKNPVQQWDGSSTYLLEHPAVKEMPCGGTDLNQRASKAAAELNSLAENVLLSQTEQKALVQELLDRAEFLSS